MKNEEKLLLAIGEISDDIILEASTPYKRKFIPTKKTMAIAASIAVVTIGITLLPRLFDGVFDKNAGGSSAPEYGDGMNGAIGGGTENLDISETSAGRMECVEKTDGYKFGFTLTLYADLVSSLDVTFESTDKSIIYTTKESIADSTEIRRPTITVNGEVATTLPIKAGEYDITISFDGMEQDVSWSRYINVTEFGLFFRFDID